MKFKKLVESFESENKMTIRVASGLNTDGCDIVVTDAEGNVLHKEEYRYGYNASHSRKWAEWYPEKPFMRDIIDGLCSKYGIDKSAITFKAGANVFSGNDVSDASVVEFRNNFVESLTETYWIDNKDVMNEVDRLSKELEADGFNYYSDRYSGSTYYNFFTKRGDNGAVCKAVQYNYDGAQIIDITIDQLIGKDPIDSFDTMRRKLGKMLLPQNEAVENNSDFPYMFFYNCDNPTFGYDFQLFACSLGARKVYGRYKGTGSGTYFYVVPSEEVYNKLKAVAKDKYTVEMQRLLPYDAEKYPNVQYIKESFYDDSDDLNEGITDSVKSAARAIAPKLKSIVNHLPEIIQGLDLVKDFYDELPEDNAVKTYLDNKGAKDVEDVYSALSGLYRIIRSSIPEHTPEKVESPSITEDLPSQEHYIVGITTDGSRMYYNKEHSEFREDIDEATIYPDKDSAMEDWFNIPRKGFKRIFVPIYEGNRLTEGAGATVVREVTDALSKVVKSDPKKLVATTTKVVDAVEDKDIDNVFDMMVKKVKDIPLPKDTIKEIKSVIGGDIDLSECTNLKTILDLMDTKKMLKENPEAAKSILMIVLTAISIIEPTPVGEVITFILGLLPDEIVAGIMQATQILNPVSAVVSGVNAAVNK